MCWAAAPLRFRQTLFIVASPKTLNLFATFAQPCWMWIASCAWSVRVVWGHAMCGVHWICCSFFWLCNWCVFTVCVQLWFLGEFSFVCFVIAIVARSTIWLPHSDSQPAFVHAAQNLRQCKRHRSRVLARAGMTYKVPTVVLCLRRFWRTSHSFHLQPVPLHFAYAMLKADCQACVVWTFWKHVSLDCLCCAGLSWYRCAFVIAV